MTTQEQAERDALRERVKELEERETVRKLAHARVGTVPIGKKRLDALRASLSDAVALLRLTLTEWEAASKKLVYTAAKAGAVAALKETVRAFLATQAESHKETAI